MDESHRLKPFDPSWDVELFEKVFRETQVLRRKLAFGIDARRFGVDYEEVVSWFDVKCIFAFQQYMTKYDQENVGDLKGYVIRALQQYSFRIMRNSYQLKYKDHPAVLDITELVDERDIISEDYDPHKDRLIDRVLSFMQRELSPNAFLVLQLELRPPSYITRELEELGKPLNAKIPHDLIAEYLELPVPVIKQLRREISQVMESAKVFFKGESLTLA